ncbi:hypothetical protein LCGC14_0326280 [marine sediment metagenome]|uniref:DUF669 domain-containing protein n=1 Tax=marine sediment metagenome TaxID=412755 RepID=A0A0F9U0L6_9ZZZZ
MPIKLDASGFESEDDAHGTPRPKPGQYHVKVLRADDTFVKIEKVIVEFKVLNGTVPGQQGTQFTEFFGVASKDEDICKRPEKTKKMLERLRVFAIACRLLKIGEKKDVDFADAEGAELIVVAEEQIDKGKKYTKIPWDSMWTLDHPDVANVPRGTGEVAGEEAVPFDGAEGAGDEGAGDGAAGDWDDV